MFITYTDDDDVDDDAVTIAGREAAGGQLESRATRRDHDLHGRHARACTKTPEGGERALLDMLPDRW